MSDFKPGDVVRYKSERENRWCREEMAIAEERGGEVRLFDTYWITDRHMLTAAEIDSAELIFNVNDYDEIERTSASGARHAWMKFAPEDRQRITSQHGLCARYFVRKGAKPDLATQIDNAREALADAESELQSAKWHVDSCGRQLAELEASAEAVAR